MRGPIKAPETMLHDYRHRVYGMNADSCSNRGRSRPKSDEMLSRNEPYLLFLGRQLSQHLRATRRILRKMRLLLGLGAGSPTSLSYSTSIRQAAAVNRIPPFAIQSSAIQSSAYVPTHMCIQATLLPL